MRPEDSYVCRIGVTVYDEPAGSYSDLLSRPTREAPDDGLVIHHVGSHEPTCEGCGVGVLRWAEAGYVPWHRVCDRCGSHWDLHPIVLFLRSAPMPGEVGRIDAPRVQDSDGCEWAIEIQGYPGVRPARGFIPGGSSWTYEEIVAEVTPALVDAALRDSAGGVPTIAACWARRARFC